MVTSHGTNQKITLNNLKKSSASSESFKSFSLLSLPPKMWCFFWWLVAFDGGNFRSVEAQGCPPVAVVQIDGSVNSPVEGTGPVEIPIICRDLYIPVVQDF